MLKALLLHGGQNPCWNCPPRMSIYISQIMRNKFHLPHQFLHHLIALRGQPAPQDKRNDLDLGKTDHYLFPKDWLCQLLM